LGISRELLAQNEIGNRDISYESRRTFYQLEEILEKLPKEDPILSKPYTDEKLVRKLNFKIEILRSQIQGDEYKIRVMKSEMAKQMKALLFCQTLIQKSFFTDILSIKLLELFQHKTQFNWEKAGPRELKKLEFYQKQKKEECAFLEDWVKGFE
jgi:hypothetical protein